MEEGLGHLRRSYLPYILALAILGGISIRFVEMDTHSLWTDEVMTLDNAYIFSSLEVKSILSNLQGPLVSLLMHFWAKMGKGEIWLRFPFALAGALTVWVAYRLTRLVLDQWRGLHVVLFISLSPLLVWYSQEIRGYAFVLLFTLLMTYYFVKWLEEPDRRSIALYGLCLYAALLSNLSAAFVGAAHFLYLLTSPRRRRLLGRWIVTGLVVMLLFAPWVRTMVAKVVPHLEMAGQVHSKPLGGAQLTPYTVPYVCYAFSVGYTLGPSTRQLKTNPSRAIRDNLGWILVSSFTFAIPVIVGLKNLIRSNPDFALLVILWLLLPILSTIAVASAHLKVFTPRYTLVALPAYAFLFGHGLGSMGRRSYTFLILLAIGLWTISIVNYFTNEAYAKDDARDAAAIIRKNFKPGDTVLAFYSAEPLVDYYLRDFGHISVFEAGDISSPENMVKRCEKEAMEAERIWLYLCRDSMIDTEGVVRSWFDRTLELVKSDTLPGVELRLYRKKDQPQ